MASFSLEYFYKTFVAFLCLPVSFWRFLTTFLTLSYDVFNSLLCDAFDLILRRFWRTIMWRSDAPLGDVLTLYCVTLWCTIAQRFWHTNVWRFRRTIVWRGDSLLYDVLTLYRVTVKRSNVWRFRLLLYDIFDALLCDVWIYSYNGFTHSCVTF